MILELGHGAKLERRGKGAVLKFCGTMLKLSIVSRKCSFTQLEHRLGIYSAYDESIKVLEKSFVKISVTSVVLDVKSSWEDSQSEKDRYLEAKKTEIKNLMV